MPVLKPMHTDFSHIPPSEWGADHWELFRKCTDQKVVRLHINGLRINENQHTSFGAFQTPWSGIVSGTRDFATIRHLPHDDIHVLFELEKEGLISTSYQEKQVITIESTPAGDLMRLRLNAHLQHSDIRVFHPFKPTPLVIDFMFNPTSLLDKFKFDESTATLIRESGNLLDLEVASTTAMIYEATTLPAAPEEPAEAVVSTELVEPPVKEKRQRGKSATSRLSLAQTHGVDAPVSIRFQYSIDDKKGGRYNLNFATGETVWVCDWDAEEKVVLPSDPNAEKKNVRLRAIHDFAVKVSAVGGQVTLVTGKFNLNPDFNGKSRRTRREKVVRDNPQVLPIPVAVSQWTITPLVSPGMITDALPALAQHQHPSGLPVPAPTPMVATVNPVEPMPQEGAMYLVRNLRFTTKATAFAQADEIATREGVTVDIIVQTNKLYCSIQPAVLAA